MDGRGVKHNKTHMHKNITQKDNFTNEKEGIQESCSANQCGMLIWI